MRDPIYEPRGAAREYAELALNVYEGCTHGCAYCYAPAVMRKTRDDFAKCRYRSGLVKALDRQLSRGGFDGRTVHLCICFSNGSRRKAMYDDNDGCLVFMILAVILIACFGIFCEWHAYVQVADALGTAPSVLAFIGWLFFSS